MNLFTLRFDEFIDKGRTRLLQSKTDFARTLAEDKERARGMRAQVEYYKDKELEVQKQSAREREEAARAEREIAEMAKKKNSKAEYRAQLLAQIEATEAAIAKKRESMLSTPTTPGGAMANINR